MDGLPRITREFDSYRFTTMEESDLRDTVAEIDRHTVITSCMSVHDLLISSETGKTTNGYTYSSHALSQICGQVASGLANLIPDIGGRWRRIGEDKRAYSRDLATEIFNRVVKLRFERNLLGTQVIRNTKSKVIDGIAGAKYCYFPNHAFLMRVSDAMRSNKCGFHEAILHGRDLMIRFASNELSEDVMIAGEAYRCGYHFANSEIGGRSIKAAILLIRSETGHCALGPYAGSSGGRVIHMTRAFERRFNSLFDSVLNKMLPAVELMSLGEKLNSISLGFGGANHKKRLRAIAYDLYRRRVTQTFAKRAVLCAAGMGRDTQATAMSMLAEDREKVLESRTGYDLFTAIMREASLLPDMNQRELAEQVAYDLLLGKIKIR